MFGRKAYQNGVYRPTKENYPLMDALAVAIAVDRHQGFVKSGEGYVDHETNATVKCNRTMVLNMLRLMHDAKGGNQEYAVDILDDDHKAAKEIYEHFDQIVVMEKLSDNLVKIGSDGRPNDFNQSLGSIFDKQTVDINKELAIIASLPNSRRISDQRDAMRSFRQANASNGFIGEVKKRVKVTGEIKDVKFITQHHVYLITLFTDESKIATFFMPKRLYSSNPIYAGETIIFVGTVRNQDRNRFTDCQETMFERVKVVDYVESAAG